MTHIIPATLHDPGPSKIVPVNLSNFTTFTNYVPTFLGTVVIGSLQSKCTNLANQGFEMCLIRLRPDREEDVVVPSRPVRAENPPSRSDFIIAAATDKKHQQQTCAPEVRSRDRIAPPEQAVIIEQISPRLSKLQIRHGFSYSYGDGPVPVGIQVKPPSTETTESQRAAQVRRRSGSLAYAKSPRQSNASYRSTRERVVVVDDSGRRREYYRRDDSWR